jgi:hypothetical protein
VLNQVDVALINTNYALEAKLNPSRIAVHRGCQLALRQPAGGPRRQQGQRRHQETGRR